MIGDNPTAKQFCGELSEKERLIILKFVQKLLSLKKNISKLDKMGILWLPELLSG